MPFMSSCAIYGLSSDLCIGDVVNVRVRDSVIRHTVNSFRLKGSFSGKGYFEFLLIGDDGETRVGYSENRQ